MYIDKKYNGWRAIRLALMNVHSDISLDTEELINTFAKKDKEDDMD